MEYKICEMIKDGKNCRLIEAEIVDYISKRNGSFTKISTAGRELGISEEVGEIISSIIFPE